MDVCKDDRVENEGCHHTLVPKDSYSRLLKPGGTQ